ncbi:hypothetical protein E2320_011894, partial [Naja naja]
MSILTWLPLIRGDCYLEETHHGTASSLQCYASNTNFWVFLEETFQGFIDFLTLKDLETLIPSSDLQK